MGLEGWSIIVFITGMAFALGVRSLEFDMGDTHPFRGYSTMSFCEMLDAMEDLASPPLYFMKKRAWVTTIFYMRAGHQYEKILILMFQVS